MKKFLLLILYTAIAVCAYGQEESNSRIEFKERSFKETRNDIISYLSKYQGDAWPYDANGDYHTALLRIKLENFSDEDAQKLRFSYSNNISLREINRDNITTLKELWLFLPANVGNFYIETMLEGYANSHRYSITQGLTPKGMYEITIVNSKLLTLMVESTPAGAIVAFNGSTMPGTTPLTIKGVAMGNHKLELSLDGQMRKDTTILVSDRAVNFNFDIRKKKRVTIKSNPSQAQLYLNESSKSIGSTPLTTELPYGETSQIVARISDTQIDTMVMRVDEYSPSIITLTPTKKRQITVSARYLGSPVRSDLDIDNSYYGANQSVYNLSIPYGRHNLRMTYNSRYKEKSISVNSKSDSKYVIDIPKKSEITMPWRKEYDADPMGLSVGYVRKRFINNNSDGDSFDVWNDNGEWLNGLQAGLYYQYTAHWGLGLHTGMYYEYYRSKNDSFDYDFYQEHSVYMPLHLYFRLPFEEKLALVVHGGLGLDYAISGNYSDSDPDDIRAPVKVDYGSDGCPNQFNMSYELCVAMRLWSVQLFASYSIGFTDKVYKSKSILTQNKLSAGVSWVFGSDN